MRQGRPSLGRTVCIAIAAALLVAGTAAQAQMRGAGGGMSMAPRISVSPRIQADAPTGLAASPKIDGSVVGGRSSLRVDPRVRQVNRDRIRVVTGRPERPPHPRGPGRIVGPGIAVGVATATGAAVGAATAAAASATTNARERAANLRDRIDVPPPDENRFVRDEVLLEFAGRSPANVARLLSRNGLAALESQFFALTDSTVVRARIVSRRGSVRATLQGDLRDEARVRAAQPNYLYRVVQDSGAPAKIVPAIATAAAVPAGGDPAQYVLSKLRLGEAHSIATGDKVLVAVIDSTIDTTHPDLAGTVAGSYDALGKTGAPHQHGTAIAGAIAAHAHLMGAAPAAKILAIRAFDPAGASAEATTLAILKGIDYAARQHARVLNMSFAGPADSKLSRELSAAKKSGMVLIAASGNLGPTAPPQYPAADPNVIAVSATDADDHIFAASNIGPHIAVAAPGVDILLPSPGNEYRIISGTSFAAAYVSGVVALMLQRSPALTPDAIRVILERTAKDLGPSGKDAEYGAGLVDAYQATVAAQSAQAAVESPDVSKRQ